MPRPRNPNRDKAFKIWKENNGDITNRKIAEMLGEKEKTISSWKSRDKWNVVLQKDDCSTTNKKIAKRGKKGAPKGNQNAAGNIGGSAPHSNSNAVTHGFFRRIFPDDEETLAIMDEIGKKSPVDMMWENIQIQYLAIARAQKLMYVRDQRDITKFLKKKKAEFGFRDGESYERYKEEEWEFQFPWDRHASFMQAQSRAIATLQNLIKRYEAMISGNEDEEQRLKLEKLKAEIEAIKGGGKGEEVEEWIAGLKEVAEKRRKVKADE